MIKVERTTSIVEFNLILVSKKLSFMFRSISIKYVTQYSEYSVVYFKFSSRTSAISALHKQYMLFFS